MASTLLENQPPPLQGTEGVNSTPNSNGGSACSTPNRKRPHPASLNIDKAIPPNKRIHTPTEKEEKETIMREKQILYKRLAEAEKSPFLLHPHQHPVFPFLPFPTNAKCALSSMAPSPTFYSLLQQQHSPSKGPLTPFPTPTPGSVSSANSSGTATTTQTSSTNIAGTIGTSSTPPRPAYPSQFYPSLLKYPFSPPTPSSLGTLGLLSPWTPNSAAQIAGGQAATDAQHSNPTPSSSSSVLATSTPRDGSTSSGGNENGNTCANPSVTSGYHLPPPHASNPTVWQMAPTFHQPTTSTSTAPAPLPHLVSPRPGFASIQSPLSYFHPSPLSPMMFIHSPYASSVSSCPSVSSSSGCSSDGGNTTAPQKKRYAPSEYYVGPIRPLSEKIADEDNQSEGASNSGRNTPTDSSSDDSGTVVMASEVGMTHNLMHSSNQVNGASVVTPSEVGMQFGTTMNDVVVQRPTQQGRPHGRRVQSPYPFSVESLSCSQPSSVGSNSHGYLHGCHAMNSVERPSSGVSSMSSSLSSRDSTPDPDNQDPLRHDLKSDPNHPSLGSDTFCHVPGRLSLLSSTQKYKVSVDEVRRRLSHPECLNASVLGGILRRAKSKNGGHVLRQRLESIGLSLPPGRRKATDLSLLTSLVEGETHHLASDFRRLCDNFFPHSELAHIIARQHTGTPEAQHRISMVKASQLIVSELQAMLNAVGGPSNIKPTDPNNPYPGLTNFSLLTHGFGNPTINTSLGVLQTYLQELLTHYEGRKPIQPDGRYLFNDKVPPPPPPPPLPPPAMDNPMMMYMGNQSVQGSNVSIKPTMTLKQEPMDSPNSCAL